jgi:hypothetical protein
LGDADVHGRVKTTPGGEAGGSKKPDFGESFGAMRGWAAQDCEFKSFLRVF